MVWLGQISYGLYLWHYVVIRSELPTGPALVFTVAAVAASWYLVEEPARRWRGRLERRSRERATAGLERMEPRLPAVRIPELQDAA